jgi:hypothetical protein
VSAHVAADAVFAVAAVLFAGGLRQAHMRPPRTPAAVVAGALGVYLSLVAGVDALAGVLVGIFLGVVVAVFLGVVVCAFYAAMADQRWAGQQRFAARRQRYADAAAAAAGGLRPSLLRLLPEPARKRLAVDLGCGAGAGVYAVSIVRVAGASWIVVVAAFPVVAVFAACLAMWLADDLLTDLVSGLRWSLWLTGRMSPRARVAVLAGIVAVGGLITLAPGPAVVRHAVAVAAVTLLPAVTVAGVGGWASVLAWRRGQAAKSRRFPAMADALAAGVSGVTIVLLIDRTMLGAQAAAGALFPVAVWLSIRGWRAMNESDRFPVRAVADVAVSLMLGTTLVALLVWLANLLRMPPQEVAVLRGVLDRAGSILDVPWWTWASVYLVLAGASLAPAVWPGRLARMTRWLAKMQVVPGAEVSRRASAGAHIGLLVIVLIGAAAPAAAELGLRSRLADRYTQMLTDNLRARGELAAYRRIATQLPPAGPALLEPLAELVIQIDTISHPADLDQGATQVELDLARRLGELQAATLAASISPPPVPQAEATATRQAGFGAPAASSAEEDKRLGELSTAEKQDDAAKKQAEQAGELAATAIARTLQLPGLGGTEVVQVIREYLSGLVEFSPLKDVFAAWAERLTVRSQPPSASTMVVPDPGKLKDTAAAQVNLEMTRTPVTDPGAVQTLLDETGIAAAVDLTNQVRYLQEDGTGPCDGCARPEQPGQHRGPEEPPAEHPAAP